MEKALEKKGRKAVFYGRHSTDKQDISTQRLLCQRFASEHQIEIIDEYLDKNKSAFRKKIETRNNLMKLLEDGEKQKFDTVFVYKIDRLARSPEQHIRLWARFRDLDIDVFDVSARKLYTTSDFQHLILEIGMSSFESENTSVRTKDFYNTHTKNGRWLGGTLPYGYRYEENDVEIEKKPKKLIIQIPEKILKVKDIFEFYVKGYGFRSIANNMNDKYPGDRWVKEKIKSIITNPFYAGYTTSNRIQKQSGNSLQPRKEWFRGKCDRIPPAISEDLWKVCMDLYEQKLEEGHDSKRLTTPFLFRDVLHCKKCEEKIRCKNYSSGKRNKSGGRYEYRKYICSACDIKWDQAKVDEELTEKLLSAWLRAMFGRKKRKEIFEDEVKESVRKDLERLDTDIKSLQLEFDQLNQKQGDAKQKLDELLLSTEEKDRTLQKIMVQLRISLQKKKNQLSDLLEGKRKERERISKSIGSEEAWLEKSVQLTDFEYDFKEPHFRNLVLFVFQRISIDEDLNYQYVARVDMDDNNEDELMIGF